MELYTDRKQCTGCGSCAAACPRGAIAMVRDGEGFAYPAVDPDLCVECGACRAACPIHRAFPPANGRFFALRARDGALLRQSSSGGAFSLIAGAVLAGGGLVCGACFDGGFRVVHRLDSDIGPMRKSKYVQSDVTGCYGPIREALNAGREVLFTGTPCQCQGLLAHFGGRPAGLRLMSLVCRGAASPGLWEDYVNHIAGDDTLEAFDFRDKRRNDNGRTVSWRAGGREHAVGMHEDGFFRLYSLAMIYRPSCYVCPCCGPDSGFDFTVGDFWGVEKVLTRLADGAGTSLVIARGPWAEGVLAGLGDRAELVPCAREDALQPALRAPAKEPLLRRFLFRDFAKKDDAGRCDMGLLLKKYAGPVPGRE